MALPTPGVTTDWGDDLNAYITAHENATTAHGATGAVVGTTNSQTLTNKDLSSGTNTFPTSLATRARKGVLLKNSSVQTLNNNTVTVLSWDGEEWDTDAFHSTATTPSRITIPSGMGGLYLVQGTVQHSATSGMGQVRFHKNGTLVQPNGIGAAALPGGAALSHSAMIPLAGGDYIELAAYQASGSSAFADPAVSSFGITFISL